MNEQRVTAFTIDRNTWLRGEGPTRSKLLRSDDGRKCCLGFYSTACGLPDDDIRDVISPSALEEKLGRIGEMEWLLDSPSKDHEEFSESADRLMEFNDNVYGDPAEREQVIVDTFAAQGITVTFIN